MLSACRPSSKLSPSAVAALRFPSCSRPWGGGAVHQPPPWGAARCPRSPHGREGAVIAAEMVLHPPGSPPSSGSRPGASAAPERRGQRGRGAGIRHGGTPGWAGVGRQGGILCPLQDTVLASPSPVDPSGWQGRPKALRSIIPSPQRAGHLCPCRQKRCPEGTPSSDLCNYSCPIFLHVFF